MRKTSLILIVSVFLLLTATSILRGQISSDTVRATVGKGVGLPIYNSNENRIDSGQSITISGKFRLSNPTVFYPQLFRPAQSIRITDSTLVRVTDSTYTFSLRLESLSIVESGEMLFDLFGEALAGSDSLTDLIFQDILYDEGVVSSFTGRIISESAGSRFPYVRFATLDPGRPNPTSPGRKVVWGFRIDKRSEVIFRIYDMIGQLIAEQDLGILDHGVYVNSFTPGVDFPSGMFIVRLITNSGEAYEMMHVLR